MHPLRPDQDLKRQNPGSSGTRWDAKNQMCVLVDQAEAYVFDKAVQVGTAAIAAVDCATVIVGNVQGVMGCALFAVEMASLTAEITSEILIQDRVQEFLRASTICKARDCAKHTIQQLGAKVISVKDSLDDHSIKNVDEELARLILLLEPEDLQSELSDGDWNSMVAAVGGETADWTGTALVWINRIGFIGQFASLGASSLRLLTKAPQALKTLLRSADNIAAAADDIADMTKALVVYDATKAADAAADAAKGAKAADAAVDAAKAADKASDAGKAAGGATSGAKAAGNADDAARGATSGAKAAGQADNAGKMHDGLSLNKKQFAVKYHPDKVAGYRNPKLDALAEEIFQKGFKGVDKLTDAEKLALSKKMFEFDELLATASKTADKAADAAADAAKAADKASDAGKAAGGTTSGAKAADAADAAADAGKSADNAADAGRAPVGNPVKSKSQKIAEARQRGDLGYHGTDADIAMDDTIRSSANSSGQLGSVGYGIAKDYDAAEKYAVKRLVERQNVGKNIKFYRENSVLIIESSEPLNLSNKTGYVYTTAKDSSVKWETLRNGYVGAFDAAQMPHSVEVLDKKAFNLDDLIRQGKVKII